MEKSNVVSKKNESLVEVRSLTLLQRILEAKCFKSLVIVAIDRSDIESRRPIYLFNDKNGKISEIKHKFLLEYSIDDRTMDNVDIWKGYDCNKFTNHRDYEKIKTKNIKVIADAFDAGLILDLRFVDRDDNGKIRYTFFKSNEICDFKALRDKESQEAWMKGLEASDNGR